LDFAIVMPALVAGIRALTLRKAEGRGWQQQRACALHLL